jgi:hypothetical protein
VLNTDSLGLSWHIACTDIVQACDSFGYQRSKRGLCSPYNGNIAQKPPHFTFVSLHL